MALVPSNTPPRMFRDLTATFGLVGAHAILHQKTRRKRADGPIIAKLADYKAVRRLVKDIVAEGIDAGVPPGVRRVVEAVTKLLKAVPHVSGKQLIAELGLHKTSVSRSVATAIGAGYLRNQQEGKGRTAEYVLGDPMSADTDVLPTAKAVLKEFRKRHGKKAR